MSKPAARITDMHTCPMVTGVVPHVGGPVVKGVPTVLVGGLPAARVSDTATCVGPPDMIAMGSATVLIGGLPAARIGDSTVHGGVIVVGLPTVLIGDGGGGGVGAGGGSAAPPESPVEVELRLEQAGAAVRTARAMGTPLPASPYSTADKLRIAQEGLTEKYIVRITKTRYAADDQGIGPKRPSGRATYWTTTFTQIEHADRDPELICHAVGVQYDPSTSYTMMVIDAKAAEAEADMTTFVPTYESLGEFAKRELDSQLDIVVDPADVDAVMTEEYSQEYLRLREEADERGLDLSSPANEELCNRKTHMDRRSQQLFATRFEIERNLGANPHFLGNGLTKDLSAPEGELRYGLVETFTYDRNPRTLADLESKGVLVRYPL